MSNAEMPTFISDGHAEALAQIYDQGHVDELRQTQFVESPYTDKEDVPYVRINKGASPQTFYVPGLSEGITSKAPFALELAQERDGDNGLDITLIDQQRRGIAQMPLADNQFRHDATYSQALDALSAIDAEAGVEPIRIIAKSYGSLVVQKMVEIAKQQEAEGGRNLLKDADIVFIAPAASHGEEKLTTLARRFFQYMRDESKSRKQVHDHEGEAGKAGIRNLIRNPLRTWREVRALARERVNYKWLMESGIGSLAVMAYGQDALYSYEQLDPTMKDALKAGATYLTPVTVNNKDEDGQRISAVEGATHNDEQFNPARVGNAVRDYFRNLDINRLRDAKHEEKLRRKAAGLSA